MNYKYTISKKYLKYAFLLLGSIYSKELSLESSMPLINYSLIETNGERTNLKEVIGQNGTLVIFSCNTCPWVLKWQDRYVSIAKEFKKKGIGVIAVNSNASRFDGDDSLYEMAIHASKNDYNFAYVQDPESKLAYAFGASKTPHVYLFNNQNKLVYRGAIDDNASSASKVDEDFLKNALDQMLEGKKITKPTSKALGCSIKF
tara:strand:+ start:3327 stop:3932 length:606 start_codon:yes stop_codon:yes gene_type:complete